nr:(d)CMP kinase [Candidatus Electrothrix aestuarii]
MAAKLGFTYLDTGAMYRAVGYACAQASIDVDNPAHQEALNTLLAELDLRLLPPEKEGDDVRVFLGDEDVSAAIRLPEMSMAASKVSAIPAVRSD